MQVNIEFESRDGDGQINRSQCFAIMEIREFDYRLVYVEDLSGEGKMTRSTLFVSPEEMRIVRKGELNMDFIYGNNMVHNTSYITPYGHLPVTLETKDYSFKLKGDIKDDEEGFVIKIDTTYALNLAGEQPINMNMKICITKREIAASR